MPLHIHTSNRMEHLVDALSGILRKPLSAPFEPEVIVVQSKGMQRWLAMELARRFGVWANCLYPFPNSMVWRLFREIMPEVPETSAFSAEVMTWKIMSLLPALLDQEQFSPLRRYLDNDPDGLKLFQLAQRIADTFDQYTLFRPEMLLGWEEETGGEEWQALLWRELASQGEGRHRGRLREEFLDRVASSPSPAPLPQRIAVFGVSYLPRYHMEIFAAAARLTEVNLLLLSPSREYWADIVSSRQQVRLPAAERDLRIEGNPLLASLGRLGRDFSDMAIELGEIAAGQADLYADTDRQTLLSALQSDILNLHGADVPEKEAIRPDDDSLQIHSCHTPMREIEILHDNLLALLETKQGLQPRDIVVMTPDIETYAPYITAVFGGNHDDAPAIPYSIADRSLTCEGEIAGLLLKLYGLAGSRLSLPQVLDVLESPAVARKFGCSEDELETIRDWLTRTRVRWGMDEHDRERFGLPSFRENSWRAGLDRLLLGYALPEREKLLFNGILPYDEMEGNTCLALGKLAAFVDLVAETAGTLGAGRTLQEWRERLCRLLDDFVEADEETAHELTAVRGVIESLADITVQAQFSGRVEPAVIKSWLTNRLTSEEKGYGFMSGGVTFCAMLPMRSIPFRVVALVGMGDGCFPRQSRPPAFDLIARYPVRGDRSLRDEDRYLFLESLLSARECLYISYVGQSVRDNSDIPPSVLVSELIDAITRGFVSDGEGIEERLVTRHGLQAFSSSYFSSDSALFSYSSDNCTALTEKYGTRWQPSEFISTPLVPPGDEWREVPLDRLVRFFRNPARFFLENRLGIRLEQVEAPLEEREPFQVDHLAAYGLKQQLLNEFIAGSDAEHHLTVASCQGILPPARHGRLVFEKIAAETDAFAEIVSARIAGAAPLAPLDVDLEVKGYRLTGRLDRIWPCGMIRYRCATTKAKDQISAWIEHLVLNAVGCAGYPLQTSLLMTDGCIEFSAAVDAGGILGDLLDLYWQGLTMPLRFFPESALEYAKKLEWNLNRARAKWEPAYGRDGEGDDPHFRLCFGDVDPFTAEFEEIARSVMEPLMLNRT
ncbi:exodeoxyribonuclease V subunit gamma [Pelotalea chapellei]|uniref:Exodeoxyribonuclease V subunit gamma n=1 Tax=Pelotalea chapellei TaxID=44671 RepID=A0ABS5UBN3_9BACT|nr:exodeoxyribonuclease V subunit gamma [Pelotalea chapellei]MBT1073094.1 exodeoxyribonuclease V subunit gamma [Pelotalea chapellei]